MRRLSREAYLERLPPDSSEDSVGDPGTWVVGQGRGDQEDVLANPDHLPTQVDLSLKILRRPTVLSPACLAVGGRTESTRAGVDRARAVLLLSPRSRPLKPSPSSLMREFTDRLRDVGLTLEIEHVLLEETPPAEGLLARALAWGRRIAPRDSAPAAAA